MVPVLVIYTRSQSYIYPGWSYTLCVGQTITNTRCWSCIHPVLAIYTLYWSYIHPLLVISTQCSVGHIYLVAQKRLQPHAQLRGDFLYWSPFMQTLPSTQLYYISLLSGYGNQAQGSDFIYGGVIYKWCSGAEIDQIECSFWQISPANANSVLENKKVPQKNFLGRKKARVQGFHEFPKMKM